MRVNHIIGQHLRKRKRTTITDRTAPPVPDLVMCDFTADKLNTRWCGDITYMAVGATWLYLATVIDICSRRVVGWLITDHMCTSLVTDAIEMVVAVCGSRVHGVVFHTDRGAQYSAAAFADVCRRHGIRRSMGRVGSSYDNVLVESFSKASKASCSTDADGPQRHRPGSICSAGCRTTNGAIATPCSATSHHPSSNSN